MLPKTNESKRTVQFLLRMSPEVKKWLVKQQKKSDYRTLSNYIDDFFLAVMEREKDFEKLVRGKKT